MVGNLVLVCANSSGYCFDV